MTPRPVVSHVTKNVMNIIKSETYLKILDELLRLVTTIGWGPRVQQQQMVLLDSCPTEWGLGPQRQSVVQSLVYPDRLCFTCCLRFLASLEINSRWRLPTPSQNKPGRNGLNTFWFCGDNWIQNQKNKTKWFVNLKWFVGWL